MKLHTFRSANWFPRPIEEVFSFFSNAHHLEDITPPWLKFQITTPGPISIGTGAHIEYKLRLRGFPIRWESEITAWEPPNRFVDEQRRGPYRFWKHEHRFVSREKGTDVTDEVQYAVFGGNIMNALLVAPDIRKIFEYRREKLKTFLG